MGYHGAGVLRFDPEGHEFKEFKSTTPVDNGPGETTEYRLIERATDGGPRSTSTVSIRLTPGPANRGNSRFPRVRLGRMVQSPKKIASSAPRWRGTHRLLRVLVAGAASHGSGQEWRCGAGVRLLGWESRKVHIHTVTPTFYPYPTPESAPRCGDRQEPQRVGQSHQRGLGGQV